MKKKQNSLLNRLQKENEAIQKSSIILNQVSNDLKHIHKNSKLYAKITLIKKLQKTNSLSSSNQIDSIVNKEFNYEYPFYIKIDYNNSPQILVKRNFANLIDHIRIEAKFNRSEPHYNNIIELKNEKIELNNRINKSGGFYGAGCGTSIGLGVILAITNMLGDTGGTVQIVTFCMICAIPIIWLLIAIYIGIGSYSQGKRIKEIDSELKYHIEKMKSIIH